MSERDQIQLFENKRIRTAWDEEKEEWYFSVVDVVAVLTDSENPRRYWSDLKRKLKAEGASQLYEKIVQLKMLSADGKRYNTDVADTEQLLRIIQSIPSPKAETFQENLDTARAGGAVAGRTRKDIESQSDAPVITSQNAAQLNQVVTDMLEGVAAQLPPEKPED